MRKRFTFGLLIALLLLPISIRVNAGDNKCSKSNMQQQRTSQLNRQEQMIEYPVVIVMADINQ
ncbi:MAG: hypothetical protein KAR42_03205 [candidate division Zixibacteria bacterium]|nr:hypothetical protein [candidate division Zixibacteria bacterium]